MSENASSGGKAAATDAGTRWARFALLAAACAAVIGFYAWSARSGILELLGSNAENTYYNLLVRGFRAGRLNVDRELPPDLVRLGGPPDPAVSTPDRGIQPNTEN